MAPKSPATKPFNVVVVAQDGRLGYEALLFLASLRRSDPDFPGKVFLAEPQPGPKWKGDPRIAAPGLRSALTDLGGIFLPFESRHFGADYPYGNKIEALAELPQDENFLFCDTDSLVTGRLSQVPFPWSRPSASMRREGTWPEIELYGPGYEQIWGALYRRFGLDMAPTIDPAQPPDYWARYMYFNAGWFFWRDPRAFGKRFAEYAVSVRDDPPPELVCQSLDPWLDQVVLPLVIHSFGGGRPGPELDGLDGDILCHYRTLPLLYAREADAVVETLSSIVAPNPIKKVLKEYEPIKRLVLQGRGMKVRGLFDRDHLPRREQMIRNQIKKAGLWMR